MKTKHNLPQRLQEIGTYASILAAIISPIAAILGFSFDKELLYALVALTLIAILYLIHQYRKAVRKIEQDGVVQRPQKLWRLLTNRITHTPGQLVKGIVMVIVPPGVIGDAEALRNIHNQNEQFNLLFHYLPSAHPGAVKMDEDFAESKPNEKKRSVDDLVSQLEDCAGIVLLDDGDWKKHKLIYSKTWKAINDWSNKHTVRPVMSIRLGGQGTLKYSWCDLDEIIHNNQALLCNLLAQSTNRGKDWYSHTLTQRRVFLISSLILIISLIFSLWLSEKFKKRKDELEAAVPKNTKVMWIGPEEQRSLDEQFEVFRKSQTDGKNSEARLLRGVVEQLRRKISQASGGASDFEVIFYAIKTDPAISEKFLIDEVAATRSPLRHFGFYYNLREQAINSIVACAAAQGSFVRWIGAGQSTPVTENIKAWNLRGEEIGFFDEKNRQWNFGGKICKFGDPPKFGDTSLPDEIHQYMLCAPVGVSSSSVIKPAGAICISSRDDLGLDEPWARQLLLHYGHSLSFFDWEKALAK